MSFTQPIFLGMGAPYHLSQHGDDWGGGKRDIVLATWNGNHTDMTGT